jgi:nucleoside-diphosphate-sugar epimerase
LNVALTGASGFIGRHVVAVLKRRSISPIAVLRPSSEVPTHLSDLRIARIDIASPPENSFDVMGRPNSLIHLAWSGLPNYQSSHHVDVELPAQVGFLKRLVKSGLRNLVVTGTCLEYGMVSGCLDEKMEPRPENPYGLAKDTLRRRLEELQNEDGFSLTWARLFYLFGDGQAENSLIPQLERAIERGDPVFNMSGGKQLRDYLPVEVAADQLVSLSQTGCSNGIVNICSGKPISVRRLVENYVAEKGCDIKLNPGYYPYPDFEPMEFWGDGRHYHELVGER